jgi:hypothetical protein
LRENNIIEFSFRKRFAVVVALRNPFLRWQKKSSIVVAYFLSNFLAPPLLFPMRASASPYSVTAFDPGLYDLPVERSKNFVQQDN